MGASFGQSARLDSIAPQVAVGCKPCFHFRSETELAGTGNSFILNVLPFFVRELPKLHVMA